MHPEHWVAHWSPSVLRFFYDWQTLIAGILALIGAAATVRKIRDQIQQTYKIEENRRKREEAASKAGLPLALSELSQFARECMRLMANHVRALEQAPNLRLPAELPRIPEDVIDTLKACARCADKPTVDQIAKVLSKLQVLNARLLSIVSDGPERRIIRQEYLERIIDAADLQAQLTPLYEYSRDEDQLRARADPGDITNALGSSGVWPDQIPGLSEALKGLKVEEKN